MIVRVVAPRPGRFAFADAAPAIVDTNDANQPAPSVSFAPNASTLEVFVLAGIITHVAVKLIDKVWR